METAAIALPPSLAATPNIELRDQTPAQLLAERAYWQAKVESCAGFASASAANEFRRDCDRQILRRRDIDPDAVPTGWVPERFCDETTPPTRPTPTDWILGPTDMPTVALLAGDSEEGESDWERRLPVSLGTIIDFMPYTDLGSAEITVHADGTWLSADSVSRFANCYRDADGEFWADTMDDLARQMLEANPTDTFIGAMVYVYRWGEPVSFVLASTPEGGFAFQRAQKQEPV